MLLTRPLVTAGISFLTTAVVVSFFSVIASIVLLIVLCVLFLIVLFLFDGKRRIQISIIFLSGLVAVGSYLLFASNEQDMTPFNDKTGSITGVVTDIIPAKNSMTGYTVKIVDSTFEDMPKGLRGILYAKTDVPIDYYDTIQIEVKARKITSSPLFNSEQYYRAKGIELTFSSYSMATVLSNGTHGFIYYTKKINEIFSNCIDRYVERPYSGLMKSMLLGNDSDMDEVAYNSITRSGISHIFVVSGMHVSMLSMLVFFILKVVGCSLRVRSIVTIVLAWVFIGITGFGIPAIRAGMMLSVLMGANLFGRPSDTLTSLFLSGIIIVLVNPLAVIDASFSLTFTATLGIILFAHPISEWFTRTIVVKAKPITYCCNVIGVTIAANLAMFPIIICVFQGISLGGLVSNLVAAPLIPVILVLGLLLLLFSGVPMIASGIGVVIEFLLGIILKICDGIASISFAYIGLNYKFVSLWLVVALILIAIATLIIRNKEVIRNTVSLSFVGLLVCLGFHSVYNYNIVEITTLNSQQAQRVVITYQKTATVIAFGDDNRIDIDVERFLRSKNVHEIENYLFLSDKQKDISDTEFLTQTIELYHLYLLESDRLLEYAQDSFRPVNGVYSLRINTGYEMFVRDGISLSVECIESGSSVRLTAGETEIVITDSIEIASQTDCEILYYCGKYHEKLTYNKAKCVIILDRFELDRLADQINGAKAYEATTVLSLRATGGYKIE